MKKFYKSVKIAVIICTLTMLKVNDCYSMQLFGGDITWTCVGKDSFIVSLTLFRDCNAITFGSKTIYIKCATTGTAIDTLTISKPTPVDITPICVGNCTRCQTYSCAFVYGIEKYVYSKLLVLSNAGSCCDILLTHLDYCRQGSITTGGAGSNIYVEAKLNRCLIPGDNSPVFSNNPLIAICNGQEFVYSNAVEDYDTDSAGKSIDSLSFAIVPPLASATTAVPFTGVYTYDKPIYFLGFPDKNQAFPRGFHLDPITGNLMFKPTKLESTIIAIKVSEWRKINGAMTKIGEVTRDLQFDVIACPSNISPIIASNIAQITEICPSSKSELVFKTYDYNSTNSLTISYSGNMPFAKFKSNNGSVLNPTGILELNPQKNHVSDIPYFFTIIVKDNACPLVGNFSKTYLVKVNPAPDQITVKDSIVNCNTHILKAVSSPFNAYNYLWDIGDSNNFVSKKGNQIKFYTNGPGNYPIKINITSCSNYEFRDTLKQDSLLYLERLPDISVCIGDSVSLKTKAKYNQGKIKYFWETGDTTPNLSLLPLKSQNIKIMLLDSASCEAYDTVKIKVNSYPEIDLGDDQYPCYSDSSILFAKVPGDSILNNSLEFYKISTNQLISKVKNSIKIYDTGSFYGKITNVFGCTQTDTINITRFPEVKAIANDQIVCPFSSVEFIADSTGSKTSSTIYIWLNQPDNVLVYKGQKFNTIANKNKDYKLMVLEWHNNKYCIDEKIISLQIKNTVINPKFPQALCAYNTPTDLRSFIDSSKGSVFSNHPSVEKGYFYNPAKSHNLYDTLLIHLTDYQSSCSWDSTVYIQLYPLSIVTTYNEYFKNQFCPDYGVIRLFGSPEGGKYGGKWYSPVVSNKYFNTNQIPGEYKLVYEFKDNNECINLDTMVLTIGNPDISIVKDDTTICNGEKFSAKAKYTVSDKMQWEKGIESDGFFNGNTFDPEKIYIPGYEDRKNHGFWLFAKTVDPVCPEVSDSVHVYIGAVPKAEFSSDLFIGQLPLNIQFTDKSVISYDQVSDYFWNFGDGNISKLKNPQHIYIDSGYYDVNLKVISNIGCSDSISKKKLIYVYPMSIPENGDVGIKVYPNPAADKIIIESETEISKVIIYNFIGVKVREFETVGNTNITLDNLKLSSGLYLLKVLNIKGKSEIFQIVINKK